jgi:hypothetical protein
VKSAPDGVRGALDRLVEYAHMSDQERAAINESYQSISAGNVGYGDVVGDTAQAIREEFAAARAAHAAMGKELADTNALLARIADEAASTQNTARRTEGQMPLIDCRLIADVFRYVGARKAGA